MPPIDYEKRSRVMARSQALGHCICDARRACPCDVFVNQDLCPCAGERPALKPSSQVRLTELVHNAGCASKIAPADLEAVLKRLPSVRDPAVLSGLAAADDAAIYRLADDLCLVQTVDVFTPCVDDPWQFGRICAANCLSDIYAMGGIPRTALSVLGFPSETLDGDIMFQMLAGAMDVLAEAQVALIGGHSTKDSEIKLGFAVTGTIDPAVAASLDRAKAGDVLVLTKPLGTGVLTFSHQIGRGHPQGLEAAAVSMATLNRSAAEAMQSAGASACTDVTGFGLFGHLLRMLRPSGLAARIFAEALPAFTGALEAFRQGVIPGAVERNREFVGSDLAVSLDADEAFVHLGFDAQTSGGLLIAAAPDRLSSLLQALNQRGVTGHVIGELTAVSRPLITVTKSPPGNPVATISPAYPTPVPSPLTSFNSPEPATCNCADMNAQEISTGSTADSLKAFGGWMRSVQSAGALSEKTKELILFSLVVLSKCGPCFETHYRKALELGLTPVELEEAAWCAIAMGGAPVRLFYLECLKQAQAIGDKSCCG